MNITEKYNTIIERTIYTQQFNYMLIERDGLYIISAHGVIHTLYVRLDGI